MNVAMKIKELKTEERSDSLIAESVNLWEGSVKATHLFLKPEEIETIKQYVPQALKHVPTLIVSSDDQENLTGFIGLSGQKIEMLFVLAKTRGQGIGKALISEASSRYQVNEVVVNEQNPQARGFYEHMGFKVYDRSETDEQGAPYPILFMKK